MLLHIRPRLFSPFRDVAIVDLQINDLRLAGEDVTARRPYPNKRYAVACRRQGQKAIDGILIETENPVDELQYTARWAVEATLVVTHQIHYKLLDHDFDAASEDMTLWYACSADLGGWSKRWPAEVEGIPPLYAEPMMEVVPREPDPREQKGWRSGTEDFRNELGWPPG